MKVPEPVSGKQKEWDEGDGLAYRSGKAGSRKDRHSKVITSKGARDRRIRLSVDTATRLFHIQQSLGLQHPSQAIDWLICTCEAAIKGFSCFLFQEGERNPDLVTYLRSLVPPKKKQQKLNRSNKSRLAKVNDHRREKARKRARERTLNKLKAQTSSALPAFQSSLPAVECDEYRTEIPLDVTENIVICASGTDLRYAFDGILATQNHELNPNFSHEKVTSPLVEEFCYVPLWD